MKNTINLLSFTAAPLSFWEKFYVWALSIGRYIIIITELIVLLAFFYKFKVDNDLSAVKNDINKNIASMKANYSQSTTIRDYENRMKNVSVVAANPLHPESIYAHTLSLIPSSIIIGSLAISTNTSITMNGSINGITQNELTTIQAMANQFKGDNTYSNVLLSNVATSTQSKSTTFTLSMQITSQQ